MKTMNAYMIPLLIGWVVLIGCSDSTEPANEPPTTPEIAPAGVSVQPGGTLSFSASASDPEGDALSFAWTFSAGSPTSASGSSLNWTAPATDQSVSVSVSASDGKGGTTTANATVAVGDEAAFPHALPDPGTLEPDLSGLSAEKRSGSEPAGLCHGLSAITVAWANTAVFIHTAIPRLAFIGAIVQPGSWIPPSTWMWSYAVETPLDSAFVELTATGSGSSSVLWEMRISGTVQELDRFLWVTGESTLDASSGEWLLHSAGAPAGAQEALHIEWNFTDIDHRTLDFINVLDGHNALGDTLSYTIDGSDATVRYSDIDEGTTQVEWDVVIGDGRTINKLGEECCWGPAPEYADISCP